MVVMSWLAKFQQFNPFAPSIPSRRRSSQSNGTDYRFGTSTEAFEERALLSAAPVVDLALGGAINYTEGSGPVVIAPAATVTDADSPTFDGGTLTASLTVNSSPEDRLAIKNVGTGAGQIGVSGTNVTFAGTVIGTFAGGIGADPLVITLNADATLAAVQALQENITFEIVGDSSVTLPRTFQSVVTDAAGGNASIPVTAIINVLEAVPVVSLSKTQLVVTNSSPQLIDAGAVVTTTGSESLNGAVLKVTLTAGTSSDQLGIQNFGKSKQQVRLSKGNLLLRGITIATVTGGTGTTPLTITFNANATLADVQKVARSITFRSTGHATHETPAVFEFTDGQGGASNSASVQIQVKRGGKAKGKP